MCLAPLITAINDRSTLERFFRNDPLLHIYEIGDLDSFFWPHRQLEPFYGQSYPGHWFDPRMLDTGQYFGIRDAGELVCAAGIHVHSPEYGMAALGNIATRPDRRRGRGLALRATARLCQSLLSEVNVVGLNVKADNRAAIACYEKLGFKAVAEYQELMVDADSSE